MEEYICKICRQFQLNAYQNISVSFAKIKLPPCIACKRFNARPSKNQKRLPASFKKVRVGVHIKGAARGGAEGAQAPPLAIRILMFIFLVFHQHCTVSRDQVHCKMFFGSPTGVTTHSLSNQAFMNFRDLRNIEAAFFIPACFALPYITRAGCCRALPVWKQA